jgi:hypothetical protein
VAKSRHESTLWDPSWFERDLVAVSRAYFASRRTKNAVNFVFSSVFLLLCAGVFGLGEIVARVWSRWIGVPVVIVASIAGFLALALFGAAGTEWLHDTRRSREAMADIPRLRARDRRSTFESLLQRADPFVLYLRNFSTEEGDPMPNSPDLDFAPPVDIKTTRWDSRLEDFALDPFPRDLPIVTVGFIGRDAPGSRAIEIFLAEATWRDAFDWLARCASLIVTVVDEDRGGVQAESVGLAQLCSEGNAPPIWLVLRENLRAHEWASDLEKWATWKTIYAGLPKEVPAGVRDALAALERSRSSAERLP